MKKNYGDDQVIWILVLFSYFYNFVSYKFFFFLVYQNQWKTYDAAVGDITILAKRTDYVEFTQPYAESGLFMIVPAKSEGSAWMFLKPFTTEMWLVTGAILIYTMLIVWFLEHQSNPEFRGSWNNQIGTALWFTFSTLFFAHSKSLTLQNFRKINASIHLTLN